MLLIYYDEKAMQARDEEQQQQVFQEYLNYTLEHQQAGVMRTGDALHGTETSRTHRLHSGSTLAVDGPFAETKEQLGGIYIIDVANIDDAVDWQARFLRPRAARSKSHPSSNCHTLVPRNRNKFVISGCRFRVTLFVIYVTARQAGTNYKPGGIHVKYLCLIYDDESGFASATEEQINEVMGAYWKYEEEIGKAGIKVAAEALQPTMTATTVQVSDGKTITTDGPFAETKEQLGGFYLLDVEDLDAAIEWAAKIPTAYMGGKIEIRPIQEFDTP